MGKLRCPCGHTISNTLWPCPYVGNVVTDTELDKHIDDSADAIRELISDGREIWECSQCGRLSFSYPRKEDNSVKWYSPDDGQPGNLMRPEGKRAST